MSTFANLSTITSPIPVSICPTSLRSLLTPQSSKEKKDSHATHVKHWRPGAPREELATEMRRLSEFYLVMGKDFPIKDSYSFQPIVVHFKVLEEIFSHERL